MRAGELEGQDLTELMSGYTIGHFAECGGSVTGESEKQAQPQKQGLWSTRRGPLRLPFFMSNCEQNLMRESLYT